MGDAEMVEQWRDEHARPNCAAAGWECFAAVSEFDYLFVCVADAADAQCGATRWIVNNCFEDDAFTPAPFSNFVEKLVGFTAAYREARGKPGGGDSDEEEELLEFLDYCSSAPPDVIVQIPEEA
jgi:hypothetical protein